MNTVYTIVDFFRKIPLCIRAHWCLARQGRESRRQTRAAGFRWTWTGWSSQPRRRHAPKVKVGPWVRLPLPSDDPSVTALYETSDGLQVAIVRRPTYAERARAWQAYPSRRTASVRGRLDPTCCLPGPCNHDEEYDVDGLPIDLDRVVTP